MQASLRVRVQLDLCRMRGLYAGEGFDLVVTVTVWQLEAGIGQWVTSRFGGGGREVELSQDSLAQVAKVDGSGKHTKG
jgi:hypothetical protein